MNFFSRIHHLPLDWIGLENIPAVPVELDGLLDSAVKLYERTKEIQPAKQGLTNRYTLNATTATGLEFLYGERPGDELQIALDDVIGSLKHNPAGIMTALRRTLTQDTPENNLPGDLSSLQGLSLDAPEQWSMAWTNFQDIYARSEHLVPGYAATLTDADAATRHFWPTIADNGLAYNLLMLKKIGASDLTDIKQHFAETWSPEWEALATAGNLFSIDLRIFAGVDPATVAGFQRFTPSTLTLLRQDPQTRDLTPFAISVSGRDATAGQRYVRGTATDSTWLYALQAAKTSVTVYGIWLGHVYHWHIVTASMQMTMYNTIEEDHALYKLIAPQANYLVQFDELLLLLWSSIAPPTAPSTARTFLDLMNTFAFQRTYFDDDPVNTLARNNITESDFSVNAPWDKYPVVGTFLELWKAASAYVEVFVDTSYGNDAAIVADKQLQAWIADAADSGEGNIRGLPDPVDTCQKLQAVLTSLIYRITAHGGSRMRPSAYPVQSFVANFPPCLQRTHIPAPSDTLSTTQLLEYLPKTGTIGEMMTFYNIFIFSEPYVPFVPKAGVSTDLFFPGGPDAPRNKALIGFREAVIAVIEGLEPDAPQRHQWPLNIET